MSYLNIIFFAIVVFPILAFLITIPYMIIQYRKYGSINKFRTLIIYSFIFYLLCIYFLVIMPLPKLDDVGNRYIDMINLLPFMFIIDFIKESPFLINDFASTLKHPTFYVPFFNILMTIPLGMYLRYYFKCDLKKTIIISSLVSLFFELTQLSGLYFVYSGPYRFCDIDDIIENTLGAVLGYYLFSVFKNILPTREVIDKNSYEQGTNVSGIRRALGFAIDLFIIILLSLITDRLSLLCFSLIFIIYFMILPLKSGKTVGSIILKYSFTFDNKYELKTLLRSFLMFIYFFGVPFLLLYVLENLNIYSNYITLGIVFFLIGVLLIFYLIINFILILMNKKLLYDKLLKTKFISNVKYFNNVT